LSACSGGARCAIEGLGGDGGGGVLGSAVGTDSGGDTLTVIGGDAMAAISKSGAMGGELDMCSGGSLVAEHRCIHIAIGSRRC
jgi:hypothetical protein